MANILIGNPNLSIGTCELYQGYGQVEDASLQREGADEIFRNCCGGAFALMLKELHWSFDCTVLFDTQIGMPKEGSLMALPAIKHGGVFLAINAIVWHGQAVNWGNNSQRKLKLKAKAYDELGATPTITTLACP